MAVKEPDPKQASPASPPGGPGGISRRRFLEVGAVGAGGLVVGGVIGYEIAKSGQQTASVTTFPQSTLAKVSDLKVGEVTSAKYPDDKSPIMIFKVGQKVQDGVGPDGDIVAYSSICTHLGCALAWKPATKVLSCPCHFSSFDPAHGGMLIMGQATTNLPQVILKVDSGNVIGTGMRGIIWGRQTNLQTLG